MRLLGIGTITPVGRGTALDVGSGTADLALLIESRMGPKGRVIASDLNHAMLAEGLKKISNKGLGDKITCLQASAEHLGFGDNTCDAVTTGFCMRNVGNLPPAVREIRRVMKPGGRFVCLEFSRPIFGWLRALYDWYSFKLLPFIGTIVASVYLFVAVPKDFLPSEDSGRIVIFTEGAQDASFDAMIRNQQQDAADRRRAGAVPGMSTGNGVQGTG